MIKSFRLPGIPAGQIGRNAVFATAQSFITIVCLFGAYRILTARVGIEAVGLWSILLAGSFMARAADVSGAGALSRFVAAHRATKSGAQVATYIHTALLTTMAFNFGIAALLYALSADLVPRFVEPDFVGEAIALVPYAIFSAVSLAPLALGVSSAIDGVNRADQRAIIVSASSLLLLALTWLLVPKMGLIGFAIAQICQQIFVIVISWFVLHLHVPQINWFPWRWRKAVFIETTGFGLKLQVNALASVLSEPMAKFLLSHWGGLAAVGYYELAARLVFQVKGLIVAATQPLIASFAAFGANDGRQLGELLSKSTRAVLWFSILATTACIAIAPVLSFLLFNNLKLDLILMVCGLAFGAGMNALSVPFYFAAFGQGILRWNILSQIQMALFVLIISLLSGPAFGTYGVVASVGIGLAFSSVVVILGNGHALGMLSVARKLRWSILLTVVSIAAICLISAAVFVEILST